MERCTISTTEERLKKIDVLVNLKRFPDRSTFINKAIDSKLNDVTVDFMYWIAIPLFLFFITTGLTLVWPNVYFFIVMGFSGIFLMAFIFLFYNKYKGVKW